MSMEPQDKSSDELLLEPQRIRSFLITYSPTKKGGGSEKLQLEEETIDAEGTSGNLDLLQTNV